MTVIVEVITTPPQLEIETSNFISVPSNGVAGQVLTKTGIGPQDRAWQTPIPGGGNASGNSLISNFRAQQSIPGNSVVALETNGIVKAVFGVAVFPNTKYANSVVGITKAFVNPTFFVDVVTHGEMEESSWGWTPGLPLYLTKTGLLSHSIPPQDTGGENIFILQIATAISPTKIFIDIKTPIIVPTLIEA
jgi:hypothetical protein